ncbi:MAG: DUF948 domain-containing protein [Candidatus Nomurabacteria bacterium]|nr:DUF948 domain-containing protein [Candidatus Nomurabacteria bacterium]
MNTVMQMQVFFFISSIGFIILWIFLAIFLFYLIRAMNTFSRIMDRVEKDINKIGDTTKDILEDIQESMVFQFLFRKRKKNHNKN